MEQLIALSGNLDSDKGLATRAQILSALRENQVDQLQAALAAEGL